MENILENKKTKNSTKLFFAGVLVLTISNLIIKAIGVLFKIPMNHIVGDQGMGYYSSAYTIYTFFYMVSTAGLPVAISLLVSENRAKGKLNQVKKVFKISMLLFLVVGIVGTAIMFFGARGFASLLKADPTYFCIIAIAPTLFFICLSSALRGYFQGYQNMLPVAISQLIEALCKLFLGIAFAMYALNRYGSGKETIHYVAAYAVLGLTIGAGLGMVFLMFSKMFFKSERYDAEYIEVSGVNEETDSSKTILKRIALIALPVTVSASVMSLTNLIDMALIQRLLQTFRGMTEAQATSVYGNYTSLCVPLFNLPPYLIYPISYSIVPMIKTAVASGDRKRADLVMESSLRVAVLIGIPCGLGMAALAKPILHFFGYRYWSVVSATPLLALLAPSTFFICVLSVTNAILQANGFERKPVISMLAGAAVKIVTNTILIRVIGMYGTPISTFLCYLTATALNIYYVVKHVGLKLRFSRIFIRPLIAGIICAAVALGVNTVSSEFLAHDVSYGYEVSAIEGEAFKLTHSAKSAYFHDASFMDDGTATDIRDGVDIVISEHENGLEQALKENDTVSLYEINDFGDDTYVISIDKDGAYYIDGEKCNFTSSSNGEVSVSEYALDSASIAIQITEDGEDLTARVTESFRYKLDGDKLKLTYPGRNNGSLTLKCVLDGDRAVINDSISRSATIVSIGAAVIVYFICIFAIRAITADDIRLLPKGAKIEKLLRKVKLIK